MLPLVASWDWIGGDLIVAVAVIGLAIFGWRQGVFVATLVGLQVLASFLIAMVLGSVVVEGLGSLEVSDPERFLGLAYLVTFAGSIAGIRLAIGRFVPDLAVPFSPLVDGAAGGFVGVVAGFLLGGAVLVAWSMAPVPNWLRLHTAGLRFDPGGFVLATFARCVEADSARRKELFEGNAGRGPWPAAPRCSEPFLDVDGDGRHEAGEPFLDVDGDGTFTQSLGFHDTRSDRRRHLGLAECYQLGAWDGVTVWHAPEIASEERVRLGARPTTDDPLYSAAARDADGPAGLVYSLAPPSDDEWRAGGDAKRPGSPLAIDASTGVVSFRTEPGEDQKRALFTIVVTDPTGLADERQILVTW
jgi:hypothetical protein